MYKNMYKFYLFINYNYRDINENIIFKLTI